MTPIEKALTKTGPMRARRLVTILTKSLNISPEAARQRLSRARTPVERYPGLLLPRREAFFYLRSQRNSEIYWCNLLRDLRETGTVYACAIDGLFARGGIVPVDEFAVVSGAPIALKKQVPSEGVAKKLVDLGIMKEKEISGLGRCFVANPYSVMQPLGDGYIRARRLTEGVILDGLRQWAWKNGIGSHNKVAIRGEGQPLMVGQFRWDLTGPRVICFPSGVQMFRRALWWPMSLPKAGWMFPISDTLSARRRPTREPQTAVYFFRSSWPKALPAMP